MSFKLNFFVSAALLLVLASAKSPVMSKRDISALACAFENLTQSMFDSIRKPIIKNFGLDMKIVDEIIVKRLRQRNVSVQLENRSAKFASELVAHNVWKSAILTFDSNNSFSQIHGKSSLQNNYFEPLLFYVYATNLSIDDILKFKDAVMNFRNSRRGNFKPVIDLMNIVNYIYYVVEGGDTIRLLTFVWHTRDKCNDLQLIEVNRFNKKTRKWRNSVFEMAKYKTFHGCQLVIGVTRDYPGIWWLDSIDHQSYDGYLSKLIEGLANSLNFTIEFNPTIFNYTQYIYSKNLVTDFELRRVSINLVAAYWHNSNYRCFFTQPFLFTRVTMAVPPGANFDGYEKLLLPFDWQTWSLILFTFVGTFLAISVLNFTKHRFRNLVFGKNISTPSLNVAAHFFGISQPTLPQGNFGRIMLTIFILYCLIIRTAWQGKMFEFLQKDMRKTEVQSIEEMIDRNFSFCMWHNFMFYYSHMEFTSRARIICQNENAEDYSKIVNHDIYDSSYKGGLQVGFDQLMENTKRTQGIFLKRVLAEDLFTERFGLYFSQYHVYFEIIERKVEQLITGGIINYYIEQVTEDLNPKRYEHLFPDEPQVLTMESLEAGFVIWLVALSLAIVVFIFEWLIRSKDLLVFKYIFTAFCKQTERMKRAEMLNFNLPLDIPEEAVIENLTPINVENEWELEKILP